MADMLGTTPDALVGRPIRDIVHEDDRASTAAHLRRARRNHPFDVRFQRVDGTVLRTRASISAVAVKGSRTGVAVVVVTAVMP
jgi:PAS domain S-box-containing protein